MPDLTDDFEDLESLLAEVEDDTPSPVADESAPAAVPEPVPEDPGSEGTGKLSEGLLKAWDFIKVEGEADLPIPPVEAPSPAQPAQPVSDEDADLDRLLEEAAMKAREPKVVIALPDHDDTLEEALMGVQQQSNVPKLVKPWMKHHKFVLVKTLEEVERIVDEAIENGHCSLDLETEGFDNRIFYNAEGKPYTKHKIVGFCIAVGDAKTGYYIPIRHRAVDCGDDLNVKPVEHVEAAIRRLCEAAQPTPKPGAVDPLSFTEFETPPRVVIEFWHAKFDQEFLYPITGIDWWHPESFEDGLLACFVVFTDDKHLGLKDKSKEKLRDPDDNPYEMIEMKELFLKGRPILFYTLAPDEEGALNYACSDAVCTRKLGLHPDVLTKVKAKPEMNFTYRLEKQVSQVIRFMERCRVKVDRPKVEKLLQANEVNRTALREKILALADSKGFHGFEPTSPKQLGEFLFGERGLNIEPKPDRLEKSQQYKTDAETLETMVKENPNAPEVLKWVVEFRGYEKLAGTYLNGLFLNPDNNDELRFDFKQTGTQTARFTAPGREVEQGFSGVPIHGMPKTKDFRELFIARPGYTMVKSDYAGQELRIAANVSGEPVWVNEFLYGDGDLHSITARAFYGKKEVTKEERSSGKTANFALIYGGGPASIIRATGCDKLEAHRRKSAFDKAVPTFAKWVKSQHVRVKKDLGIWNPFGRWISIPDANVKDGSVTSRGKHVTGQEAEAIRAACERHSCNYPIQSGGADVMKIALVLLYREFYKKGWLRNGGDDSIRMLLTVHDEIVFEIRHDRVPEALAIIIDRMAAPGKIPKSPPWKVPLIVEPLIGTSWGGEYDYAMLTHGKEKAYEPGEKLKDYEIRIENRIYHKVPPWLKGILRPGYTPPPDEPASPVTPPTAPPEAPPEVPPAPPTSEAAPAENQADVSFGSGEVQATSTAEAPVVSSPDAPVLPAPAAEPPKTGAVSAKRKKQVLTFRLREGCLDMASVRSVYGILSGHNYRGADSVRVRIYDSWGANVLVDPEAPYARNIQVRRDIACEIVKELSNLHLTDGAHDFLDK